MWANKKKKKMCLHKPYLKEGRCRFSYVWLYDVFMCLCVLVDHQFVHGEFLSDLRSTVLCQDAALISVAMRPQGLSGIHSSMQATAKTWSRPLTARLWLPYRPTSPGLEKKKKKVQYWLHFTEQTSEEVSVVTLSQCGCCVAPQACRATGCPISGFQRLDEVSLALCLWPHLPFEQILNWQYSECLRLAWLRINKQTFKTGK